ncbi:MAG: membrane dipeptidase [Armatimonadota bacterium]|nr:membrane dipeptidase [Armatimonadota bacterium]MDR7612392.1 membrane dipeptidase [Armatimonadota bacterium]
MSASAERAPLSPDDRTAFHRSLTVVDGHCDLPLALTRAADARGGDSPALAETRVGRDLRQGGVDVVVSPVWVELEYLPDGLRRALVGLTRLRRAVGRSPEEFAVAETREGLERAVRGGRTAVIPGLEGCAPLGYEPDLLETFVRLGVRVVGLTWNERNAFASGARQDSREGLTPLGKALVREGDRLGVIWDVSHLNERSFWDLLECAAGPVVASHSNAAALFPHARNLSDDQIRALSARGGLISLMVQSFVISRQIATLEEFLRHVDHVVELAGIERVGFGFDFISFVDDIDRLRMDSLPPTEPPRENAHKALAEIPTHADLPRLTDALLRHGYSPGDVARLMGGNWLGFLLDHLPAAESSI